MTDQNPKHKIVVVGGGRNGEAILDLLASSADFAPFVLEINYDRLRYLHDKGIDGAQISGSDANQIAPVLADASVVICAAPASVAPPVARAALRAGCHYVDMSESPDITQKLGSDLAGSSHCFVPGCGLAPGLVTTLTDAMITQAPDGADITVYVGVLPAQKTNRLGYGNIWGIDGLMVEYTQPCLAIESGEMTRHAPLGGYETLSINGQDYEAFYTAGSLDNLVNRYQGKLHGLTFKTLRYPGHLDYIQFLLEDLKLSERLYMLRNLLMNGLQPMTHDRVVIQIIDRNPDGPRRANWIFDAESPTRSAVSSIAAQHVCAVVDILTQGLVPHTGLLHHTDLTLDLLKQSRFGARF